MQSYLRREGGELPKELCADTEAVVHSNPTAKIHLVEKHAEHTRQLSALSIEHTAIQRWLRSTITWTTY